MALIYNGTKILLPGQLIPEGYTLPEIKEVEGTEYKTTHEVLVAKADVTDGKQAATFGNIVDEMNTAIEALLDNDYNTSANIVEAHGELVSLSSSEVVTRNLYGNLAVSYVLGVKLYVKTTPD